MDQTTADNQFSNEFVQKFTNELTLLRQENQEQKLRYEEIIESQSKQIESQTKQIDGLKKKLSDSQNELKISMGIKPKSERGRLLLQNGGGDGGEGADLNLNTISLSINVF